MNEIRRERAGEREEEEEERRSRGCEGELVSEEGGRQSSETWREKEEKGRGGSRRKERERMVMSKPTSNLVMTMPRGWDW